MRSTAQRFDCCHQSQEPTHRTVPYTRTPAQWQQLWAQMDFKIIGHKAWHHNDIMGGEIETPQIRGYRLLFYIHICHYLRAQWVGSITSTGLYGHHKSWALIPQPFSRAHTSPSVGSCNSSPISWHCRTHQHVSGIVTANKWNPWPLRDGTHLAFGFSDTCQLCI